MNCPYCGSDDMLPDEDRCEVCGISEEAVDAAQIIAWLLPGAAVALLIVGIVSIAPWALTRLGW